MDGSLIRRATTIDPAIWDDTDMFLVADGGSFSAHDIRERVAKKAGELADAGFSEKMYVPFAVDQSPESLVFLLAAWQAGATPVLLNPKWPQAMHRDALAGMGLPPKSVSDPSGPVGSTPPNSPESFPDGGAVVFTSGSTGTPKAVALTRSNLAWSALQAAKHLDFRRGDRWLLSLPLYHVGGLGIVARSLLAGAPLVLAEPGGDLLSTIRKHGITHVSLVATQLYRLVREPDGPKTLAGCRAVVLGGGPTPESLLQQAFDAGIALYSSFGMTETASMVCCTCPGDGPDRLNSAGPPMAPDTVDCTEDGEICVRGPMLFAGYVENSGNLSVSFDENARFSTGDLGRFDENGYLRITGRRDNRFVCGGENVQPEEIEAALLEVPGIEQAIVLPAPDPEYGQRPVAFIRMAHNQGYDAAGLQKMLRDRLPGIKIPAAFHPWPGGMENASLKASRKALAEKLAELEAGR